jgi:hypothetical protein
MWTVVYLVCQNDVHYAMSFGVYECQKCTNFQLQPVVPSVVHLILKDRKIATPSLAWNLVPSVVRKKHWDTFLVSFTFVTRFFSLTRRLIRPSCKKRFTCRLSTQNSSRQSDMECQTVGTNIFKVFASIFNSDWKPQTNIRKGSFTFAKFFLQKHLRFFARLCHPYLPWLTWVTWHW